VHFESSPDQFAQNEEYQQGRETEGKKFQAQAALADAVPGAVTAVSKMNKEVKKDQDLDKISKDALKDTDTSTQVHRQ
jgi:hypothetical protein